MPDFNPAPSSDYQLQIEVRPEYLPEESNPPRQYLFAYHVTITNTGSIPVQVIARHWIITDAYKHVEEVRGLAVVGHQPLLEPGDSFTYSSGTPLRTPEGRMEGSFFCVAVDGTRFDAPITPFLLQAQDQGPEPSAPAGRVLH